MAECVLLYFDNMSEFIVLWLSIVVPLIIFLTYAKSYIPIILSTSTSYNLLFVIVFSSASQLEFFVIIAV